MSEQDRLYRGLAYDGQFRVFAVHSTQTVQQARDLHDLSPLATLLLGKMITAAAMMSLELKVPGSELTLRVQGDGELQGATVICSFSGDLRGHAFQPRLFFEQAQENFLPGKHIGKGTLSVSKYFPHAEPQTGHVSLEKPEFAENLANFYLQSEQIPTAVNLGILLSHDATIKAAGGYLIQQLPHADPFYADVLIDNIAHTPNVSDLMDMGLSLPEILSRFVFKDAAFKLEPVHGIRYRCNCSRQRFRSALKLLGKDELEDMREGVKPVCHYCNREYQFSTVDIAGLISELENHS